MPMVLIVDDSEDSAKFLKQDLNDDGVEAITALSGDECLALAVKYSPDLILLDMKMPGLSGLDTLEKLKTFAETRDIPVIMVSASSADQSIIEALDYGANDYVYKPVMYPVLAARMRAALRLRDAVAALEEANRELTRLATTDSLTHLNNRRHFFALAHAEFSRAQRYKRPLAMIMLDVDAFKMINDTYGHAAGDKALDSLADCCREAVRDSDVVGRIGGEEFAICCPDADLGGAHAIAERIRKSCEAKVIDLEVRHFSFTVSLGVTSVATEDASFENMLHRADKLLYEAKTLGRNRSVAY